MGGGNFGRLQPNLREQSYFITALARRIGKNLLMAALTNSGADRVGRFTVLGLVLLAFAVGAGTIARRPPPAPFLPSNRAPTESLLDPITMGTAATSHELRGDFISTRLFVHTHAANLVELEGGRVRAFWYSGTNEGTQDVTIQTAVYDPDTARWSPEKTVTSRADTQRALFRYVKKLGNPVAARAADGSLSLFYVTVSLGGWAGSSITVMSSHDNGETWNRPRRIVTSPFFNLSTLVKTPPFAFADGTLGLPVHHEFMGKFGEVLRLDAAATVLDKARLSAGRACLQPVVMIEDATHAIALMRYAGATRPNRVMRTTTSNAGRDWTPPERTALGNSDAALTGLVLPDGDLLLALNNAESGRNALTLAVSSDFGATWRTIYHVEDQSEIAAQGLDEGKYSAMIEKLARATDPQVANARGMAESVKRQMFSAQGYSFEFSYPSLIRTSRGDYHLVYTWNEAFIKHVQFDQAWLDRHLN
jgi:predicted neuraminidase